MRAEPKASIPTERRLPFAAYLGICLVLVLLSCGALLLGGGMSWVPALAVPFLWLLTLVDAVLAYGPKGWWLLIFAPLLLASWLLPLLSYMAVA